MSQLIYEIIQDKAERPALCFVFLNSYAQFSFPLRL